MQPLPIASEPVDFGGYHLAVTTKIPLLTQPKESFTVKRLLAILAPLLFTATLLAATPAEVPGRDFTTTGCEAYSDSVADADNNLVPCESLTR